MSIIYNKTPITYEEQISHLLLKGFVVNNEAELKTSLQNVGFSRFSTYSKHFLRDGNFILNTDVNQITHLIDFDRNLRLYLFSLIEKIEISFREELSYQFTHQYGANGYRDETLFYSKKNFYDNNRALDTEILRSNNKEIVELCDTYTLHSLPFWSVKEVMSFGLLSKFYDNLNHNCRVKESIAQKYGLNYEILTSWLRHLNVIRNICAHHSYLWNHHFTVTPITQRRVILPLIPAFNHNNKRIYNGLLILKYLSDHSAATELDLLLNNNSQYLPEMGFPREAQSREAQS